MLVQYLVPVLVSQLMSMLLMPKHVISSVTALTATSVFVAHGVTLPTLVHVVSPVVQESNQNLEHSHGLMVSQPIVLILRKKPVMSKSMVLSSVPAGVNTNHLVRVELHVDQLVAMSIQFKPDIDVGMTTLARIVAAAMEVVQAMIVSLLVAILSVTKKTREIVILTNASNSVFGKNGELGLIVLPTVQPVSKLVLEKVLMPVSNQRVKVPTVVMKHLHWQHVLPVSTNILDVVPLVRHSVTISVTRVNWRTCVLSIAASVQREENDLNETESTHHSSLTIFIFLTHLLIKTENIQDYTST